MAPEAFGYVVERKERCSEKHGRCLNVNIEYTNTNNEKDNIITTVFTFKYVSKITIILATGTAGQPFLHLSFPGFRGIPFVAVIAWSEGILVAV